MNYSERARLRSEQRDAIAKARALHDKAESENRDLTKTETREFGKLIDEFHRIGESRARLGEISESEAVMNLDGSSRQVDMDMCLTGQHFEGQRSDRDWSASLRDETTGAEIRGYTHGEKISRNDGASPFELGMLIRDKITGSRDLSPERRQVQVDSDSHGGFLLSPFGSGQIWDLARAASVVSAAGAVTVPVMQRELSLGKIVADPTAAWVPEGGTIALDDAMRFGSIKARGRKLALRIEITDEMIRFGNSAQLITQTCATALAQEMDRAALAGDGSGEEPVGVLHTTGIQTAAASPAAIDIDQMLDVYTALQAANVQPNAYIMHPTMAGNLAKLRDGEGQYYGELPADLQALKKHVTSKMTSTVFLMAEFKNLLLLPNASGVQIDLVKDVVSGRGCWLLQLIGYMDVACVWPNRFYALTGVNG